MRFESTPITQVVQLRAADRGDVVGRADQVLVAVLVQRPKVDHRRLAAIGAGDGELALKAVLQAVCDENHVASHHVALELLEGINDVRAVGRLRDDRDLEIGVGLVEEAGGDATHLCLVRLDRSGAVNKHEDGSHSIRYRLRAVIQHSDLRPVEVDDHL